MRAGSLDRQIVIYRWKPSAGTDDAGQPVASYEQLAVVRAQVIDSSTEEFVKSFGASREEVVLFRTRYISRFAPRTVDVEDLVDFGGFIFKIVGIKEIGRRRGLELRTIRYGPRPANMLDPELTE